MWTGSERTDRRRASRLSCRRARPIGASASASAPRCLDGPWLLVAADEDAAVAFLAAAVCPERCLHTPAAGLLTTLVDRAASGPARNGLVAVPAWQAERLAAVEARCVVTVASRSRARAIQRLRSRVVRLRALRVGLLASAAASEAHQAHREAGEQPAATAPSSFVHRACLVAPNGAAVNRSQAWILRPSRSSASTTMPRSSSASAPAPA